MMGQPPMGAAPNAVASGNPGQVASAMSGVRTAITLLEKELPNIPLDNPLHKTLLNAIKSLSAHAPASAAVPGQQATAMKSAMEQAQRSAPLQQLMRMSPSGGIGAQPAAPGQAAAAAGGP